MGFSTSGSTLLPSLPRNFRFMFYSVTTTATVLFFYVYILDTFCRCHSYLFSLTLTMLVCCMKFNPFSSFRLELLEFPVNTSVPWLPLCMLTCYVNFTILNRPNLSFDIFLISCLHDTNIGSTPPSYTFNCILYFSNMYLLQHDIFGTS